MRTRVEELFHQVVDLSTEARDRHFAESEIAPETRSEVEALIEFDVKSTTSFETGLGKVTRTAFEQFEAITMHCGPYQLVRLLGRGGMGTVTRPAGPRPGVIMSAWNESVSCDGYKLTVRIRFASLPPAPSRLPTCPPPCRRATRPSAVSETARSSTNSSTRYCWASS